MINPNVIIRGARQIDIPQIKQIADKHKTELGFAPKQSFVEAVERKDLIVAELENRIVGFQQFRTLKKAPQITLYRKAVIEEFRKQGIGTKLVDFLIELAKTRGIQYLKLKCVEGLPSNDFHLHYGFKIIEKEKGKIRSLNVYFLKI